MKRVFIGLFIVSVAAFLLLSFYTLSLRNEIQILTESNEKLIDSNKKMENDLESKTTTVEELGNDLEEGRVDSEALNREIEELNSAIDDLNLVIEDYENIDNDSSSEISEIQDELSNLRKDYYTMLEEVSLRDIVLIIDDKVLKLHDSYEQLIELYGEPIQESISLNDGSGIWYLEGKYDMKCDYENFEVRLLGDENMESFNVIYVRANDSSVKTLKGLCLGDNYETFEELYSYGIHDNELDVNQSYYIEMMEFYGSLDVEIEDETVISLGISASFP